MISKILVTLATSMAVVIFVPSQANAAEPDPALCNLIFQQLPAGDAGSYCLPSETGDTVTVANSPDLIRIKDVVFEKTSTTQDGYTTQADGYATVVLDAKKPAGKSAVWGGFPICKTESTWVYGTSDGATGPYFLNPLNDWFNNFSGYQSAALTGNFSACASDLDSDRKYLIYAGIGTGNAGLRVQGYKAGILATTSIPLGTYGSLSITDVTSSVSGAYVDIKLRTKLSSCDGTYTYTGSTSIPTQIQNCFVNAYNIWKSVPGHPTTLSAPNSTSAFFAYTNSTPSATTGTTTNTARWEDNGRIPGTSVPCLQKPSGTEWIMSKECVFSFQVPASSNTYLRVASLGSSTIPSYNSWDSLGNPTGGFFASYLPSNSLWSSSGSAVDFSGYDIVYAVVNKSMFDDLVVIPDAPGIDEIALEDAGLCLNQDCIDTMCDDEGGFLNLAKLKCFIIPPDLNWGKFKNTISLAWWRAPNMVLIKNTFDQVREFGKDMQGLEDQPCSHYEMGFSLSPDSEVFLCPDIGAGVNWAFYNRLLGFTILLGALLVSIRILKSMLLLEKQIDFGLFDSDDAAYEKGIYKGKYL